MNHGYIVQELALHSLPNGSKLECIRMIKDLSTDAENMHSDTKRRRSFLAPLFPAGDVKRLRSIK